MEKGWSIFGGRFFNLPFTLTERCYITRYFSLTCLHYFSLLIVFSIAFYVIDSIYRKKCVEVNIKEY